MLSVFKKIEFKLVYPILTWSMVATGTNIRKIHFKMLVMRFSTRGATTAENILCNFFLEMYKIDTTEAYYEDLLKT